MKVLVTGASVAGPFTAYWLARAGAQVTVLERFPAIRPGGQSLDIRQTAVEVVKRVPGLEQKIRNQRAPFDGMSLLRPNGTEFARIVPSGKEDKQALVSEYEILRGDLSQTLVDLTKNDPRVQYVFGDQVKFLENRPDGVSVDFQSGKKAEYDLVVGCDGANSTTRAFGLGGSVSTNTESTGIWQAYFTLNRNLTVGEAKIANAYSGPGSRALLLSSDVDRNKSRAILIKQSCSRDDIQAFRDAQAQGDKSLRGHTIDTFSGMGWISSEILKEVPGSDEFYASESIHVKLPKYYKDRVVLVGDAGYATGANGTGTSLAMTGAYVLGGELASARASVSDALEAYEQVIRPLVAKSHGTSPWAKRVFAPHSRWGLTLRNSAVSFCYQIGLIDAVMRKLSSNLSAEPIILKNYKFNS